MSGLAHDGEFAGAIQVTLRGETGAQGMAGVTGGIDPKINSNKVSFFQLDEFTTTQPF